MEQETQKLSAWDRQLLIRDKNRPTVRDYIPRIFTDFYELHGDRGVGDDGALIGGICRLNGTPVTVLAQVKGRNIRENKASNFAMPHPEGYRKALRLMKQAEKFHRPVLCFVDTAGAYCGLGAEERGQGSAIAQNLVEMMGLKTPVISVLIGEGGSGGALALAVADRVYMLENAVYSVISPEGAASILYKDAGQVERAAEALRITAGELKEFGVVEEVISEQSGFEAACAELKKLWIRDLDEIEKLDSGAMLDARYNRFRKFGGLME